MPNNIGYSVKMKTIRKPRFLEWQIAYTGAYSPVAVTTGDKMIWRWGDGAADESNEPSHTYTDNTLKTVRLRVPQSELLTSLIIGTDVAQAITGTFTPSMLAQFSNLATFKCYGPSGTTKHPFALNGNINLFSESLHDVSVARTNSNISGNLADLKIGIFNCGSSNSTLSGNLANLSSSITQLYCSASSCAITGNLPTLPSGMTNLNIDTTPSTVTIAIAGLPAGMSLLNISNSQATTKSVLVPGSGTPACLGINTLSCVGNNMTQSQMDAIIDYVYQNRMLWTNSAPRLLLTGNARPSGTLANSSSPTTGLQKVYKLRNDPDNQGFKKWTITYS